MKARIHRSLPLLTLLTVTSLAAQAAEPCSAAAFSPTSSAQRHDWRGSPFDGLRWEAESPEVNVDGSWYRPLKIGGVEVQEILDFCEKRWPGKRERRFGEDLVEALELMGHEPQRTVDLELKRLSDGAAITLTDVEMTEARRNRIRDGARPEGRPVMAPPASVPADVARRDLAWFQEGLERRFAYLQWKGVDLERGIEEINAAIEGPVDVGDLADALDRLIMGFGDGHAAVRSRGASADPGLWLPFLLQTATLEEGGVAALLPDRSGFFEPGHPFLISIDGVPVEEWFETLRPLVVDGSPQLVEQRLVRRMIQWEDSLRRVGRVAGQTPKFVFGSLPQGGKTRAVEHRLARRRPRGAPWPKGATRRIEEPGAAGVQGGIGYLRIPSMDDEAIPALRAAMTSFRGTGGLIVDVRGNGGGRRGLLAALGGYLSEEGGGPVVGNCAAYRLAEEFKPDHLGGSRLLYRADDPRWSDAQSAAIKAFQSTFRPAWELPEGFSPWHYLVLDKTGHEGEYDYEGQVVVLMDEGCFSATDIFVGALGELSQVTLMGKASGGGSARSESFVLPGSRIEVRCASMASFQPSGQLYDGTGVMVDVEVDRGPNDLLEDGRDSQLEAAVKFLASR